LPLSDTLLVATIPDWDTVTEKSDPISARRFRVHEWIATGGGFAAATLINTTSSLVGRSAQDDEIAHY
jgi:hypothetical protein